MAPSWTRLLAKQQRTCQLATPNITSVIKPAMRFPLTGCIPAQIWSSPHIALITSLFPDDRRIFLSHNQYCLGLDRLASARIPCLSHISCPIRHRTANIGQTHSPLKGPMDGDTTSKPERESQPPRSARLKLQLCSFETAALVARHSNPSLPTLASLAPAKA